MYRILKFSFYLILLVFSFFSNAQTVLPQPYFDGFYLGANAGVQNVFGGSFVEGEDVLAQESRFVLEFDVGFRKQLLRQRIIVGLEAQMGFLNADLSHYDMDNDLEIAYSGNFQKGIGLNLGYAFGKNRNILLFGYMNETKRKFNVNINFQGRSFEQTDKQGMLKYGLGLELPVSAKIHIRGTIGKLNVDFGELITNINVEDKLDYTLGMILQL